MSGDGGAAAGAGPATCLLKLRSNVELEGDVRRVADGEAQRLGNALPDGRFRQRSVEGDGTAPLSSD